MACGDFIEGTVLERRCIGGALWLGVTTLMLSDKFRNIKVRNCFTWINISIGNII